MLQEHAIAARAKLAKITPSTPNGRKARTALRNDFKWKAALGGAIVGVRNALAQGNNTNASVLGEQAELDFKLARAEYDKAVCFLPGLRI